MSLAKTRAEQTKALNGAWVKPENHGYDGVAFKVRGWNNPDFQALQAKLANAVARDEKLPDGRLTPAAAERISNECIVQTVLLDWDGLRETDEADPLLFSKEKAREIVFDPLLRPLRDAVMAAGLLVAKDGKDSLEEDAKN